MGCLSELVNIGTKNLKDLGIKIRTDRAVMRLCNNQGVWVKFQVFGFQIQTIF